jgi:hypothetical protein
VRALSPPLLASLALLLALAAQGCGHLPWRQDTVLYNDGSLLLFKEHKVDEEGRPEAVGHRHPISVPPEKMVVILSRLRYEKVRIFRDPVEEHVFTPREAEKAGQAISAAVEILSPDERLRFLATRKGIFGPSATSGVVFSTREGGLDLAFDVIWGTIPDVDDEDPLSIPFPHEPTEYRARSTLLVMPGGRLHFETDMARTHPRWLEIELAEVVPAVPPESTVTPASATPAAGLRAGSPAGASTAVPAAAAAPVTPEERARYEKAAQRIKLLKSLRASGALTVEEYEKALEQALSEAE